VNIVSGALQAVGRTADAATATAGAIGGAAVDGVIGGIKGAGSGIYSGLRQGSHSTVAAAMTVAAIGATGLVEWPVLLTVGGAVLVVHEISQRARAGHKADPSPSQPAAKSSGSTRARKATTRPTAARSPGSRTTK
jgi:hypothetical protein